MLGVVVRMYGTRGSRYYYYSPYSYYRHGYAEDGGKTKGRRRAKTDGAPAAEQPVAAAAAPAGAAGPPAKPVAPPLAPADGAAPPPDDQ